MRSFVFPVFIAVVLAMAGSAQAAELNVTAPGVAFNAGLPELAAAYTQKTGVKVTVKPDGMANIVHDIKTVAPIADVMILPVAFMDGMEAEGSIVAGSRAELGRVNVGLAVKKGAPHPDISSVARLATALKSASAVLYSDPASGSMEARIINDMLRRTPQFAGVHGKISTKGEGGEALIRGEGDMALQLSCEVLNHPELELVGLVPIELGAYIDTSVAVSTRSTAPDDAKAFITYLKSPEAAAVLKARGMAPAQ
jgi:molybdate transport system substrate-binding protein